MACVVCGSAAAWGASAKRLAHIEISGNTSVSEKDILKTLNLKTGKRVKPEKIQQAFGRLQVDYLDRGFFKVQIATSIQETPKDVSIAAKITEGPLYRVGAVTVQGNQEISEKNIRRELEVQEGDPFSQAKLLGGNKRLYAVGSFEVVDVLISTAPEHTVNVNVKVRERRQKFIKGGAGYGTETKERLSVGYEDQNFLGDARRADIKYTYSGFVTQPEKFETRTLEATLTQPFFLDTRMEGQLALERSTKFREAYDSIENEIRGGLERRYGASSSVRATYRLQGTDLTRVSPQAETPSETSVNAIGATLRYDNTDHPFLPFQGWRAIGSLEEGLRLLKNDVGFHKIQTRVGRFDTIDSGWTFFEGVQFGLLLPRSGSQSNVIPINERFFLGGANSVRGYSERTLGPKDDQNDPLGGTFFLVTNVEVRHRIYKKVFGMVFFDMGQLYDYDPGDVNPHINLDSINDLAQSCGLGFRLHSPIGAIRLEGGYQLNPPAGASTDFEDRTALHFSIGEVF